MHSLRPEEKSAGEVEAEERIGNTEAAPSIVCVPLTRFLTVAAPLLQFTGPVYARRGAATVRKRENSNNVDRTGERESRRTTSGRSSSSSQSSPNHGIERMKREPFLWPMSP